MVSGEGHLQIGLGKEEGYLEKVGGPESQSLRFLLDKEGSREPGRNQ